MTRQGDSAFAERLFWGSLPVHTTSMLVIPRDTKYMALIIYSTLLQLEICDVSDKQLEERLWMRTE